MGMFSKAWKFVKKHPGKVALGVVGVAAGVATGGVGLALMGTAVGIPAAGTAVGALGGCIAGIVVSTFTNFPGIKGNG